MAREAGKGWRTRRLVLALLLVAALAPARARSENVDGAPPRSWCAQLPGLTFPDGQAPMAVCEFSRRDRAPVLCGIRTVEPSRGAGPQAVYNVIPLSHSEAVYIQEEYDIVGRYRQRRDRVYAVSNDLRLFMRLSSRSGLDARHFSPYAGAFLVSRSYFTAVKAIMAAVGPEFASLDADGSPGRTYLDESQRILRAADTSISDAESDYRAIAGGGLPPPLPATAARACPDAESALPAQLRRELAAPAVGFNPSFSHTEDFALRWVAAFIDAPARLAQDVQGRSQAPSDSGLTRGMRALAADRALRARAVDQARRELAGAQAQAYRAELELDRLEQRHRLLMDRFRAGTNRDPLPALQDRIELENNVVSQGIDRRARTRFELGLGGIARRFLPADNPVVAAAENLDGQARRFASRLEREAQLRDRRAAAEVRYSDR